MALVAEMTEADYLARHARNERFVNRVSFLCDIRCREKCGRATWTHHAWALLQFLANSVDAEFYGDKRPTPATGIAHLDADLVRHRDRLERRLE